MSRPPSLDIAVLNCLRDGSLEQSMTCGRTAAARSEHICARIYARVLAQKMWGTVWFSLFYEAGFSSTINYLNGNLGGAEEDRTPDLCSAIAALSQLSYGP